MKLGIGSGAGVPRGAVQMELTHRKLQGALVASLFAGGCAATPEDGAGFFGSESVDAGGTGETPGGEASGDGDGPDTATTGDTDGGDEGSSGDGVKFDLGEGPDAAGEPEAQPCERVDMLFVVDNSGSMAGEQENLANSFPGFVNEMLGTLETVDSLHVGVVPTDENTDNAAPCNKMGALVTQTPYATCGPYLSGNYMTQDDPLDANFVCAATLGTGGSGNERPMDALGLAISDAYAQPGACNEGFLRDDALLVVVVISDEEDDHESVYGNSQGDPPDWFQTVVDAKNGIETNAAVLTIVGQDPIGDCDTTPFDSGSESSEPAIRLMEFASMFTYGFIGDVCADDYQPIFHEAISVIDSACTNFTPPEG